MQSGETKHRRLRLHLIGENRLLRDAMAATLSSDCEVRTHLGAPAAIRESQEYENVVVLEFDSFEALEEYQHLVSSLPAVAIVRAPAAELLSNLLKVGFAGILTLKASLEDLRHCIRHVRTGGTYLDTHVQRCLSEVLIAPKREQLTARERQVAILVAEGLTSRAIASRLSLSAKTVNNHRRNIFRKLGIHDAISLTRHVVCSGWVPRDPMPIGRQERRSTAPARKQSSPASRSRSTRPKVRSLYIDHSGQS